MYIVVKSIKLEKSILKNMKQAILSTIPNIVSKTKYTAVCVHVLSHESDVKFI